MFTVHLNILFVQHHEHYVWEQDWNNSAETRMCSKMGVKIVKNIIMPINFPGIILSSCGCSKEKH